MTDQPEISNANAAQNRDERFFRIGGPLTAPLAPLYSFVSSARNKLYDAGLLAAYRAPLPVICVGNATVGGSGKSPLAAAIARRLKVLGLKPVILSRGYGGSAAGPLLVGGGESADLVGDEPLMHKKFLNPEVPVVVSRDRVIGAAFIAEKQIGDVVVLDDGYQHRRLKRDLNILLADASSERSLKEWEEGRMLPAGRFREQPSQAIRRAQAVVAVSRSDSAGAKDREEFKRKIAASASRVPVIGVELYSEKLIELESGNEIELGAAGGMCCSAACGLARPEQFFSAVESLGVELIDRLAFGDHHPYSSAEVRKMLAGGAPLVVTAKDAVKIQPFCRPGDKILVLMQGMRCWSEADNSALEQILQPFAPVSRP